MFSPIVFNQVRLCWPDGTICLSAVNITFSAGLTGIIGNNGAGKSSLLKLVTGQLQPTTGSLSIDGTVGVLPQNLILDAHAQLADLLGIGEVLAAIKAIESGDPDPRHFEVIGDDWDAEARATKALAAAGLSVELTRPVRQLSGGEAMLAAITGLRLARNPVTVLDEPTNNLDRDTRQRLYQLLADWPGTLLVVSHDVGLLRLAESIAEVRDGEVRSYGGNWDDYLVQIEVEQEAAQRALTSAQQRLRSEQRKRDQAQQRLAHRQRYAAKQATQGIGKMAQNYLTNRAERSSARSRTESAAQLAAARDQIDSAEQQVRVDDTISIDLPDPAVATGRRLATFVDTDGQNHLLAGPERVGLVGPNGVGKTLLLQRLVTGSDKPPAGLVQASLHTERVGYLPQRPAEAADEVAVLDYLRQLAPTQLPADLRNRLARFGLRGDAAFQLVGSLSGGERFRVELTGLLLADPPAQLLVLDEPTNSLDLATTRVLVDALSNYRGGLLVVSHDDDFLARLGVSRLLRLDQTGKLNAESLAPGPHLNSMAD